MDDSIQHGMDELKQRLRAFAAERDWEQYHSPKNLAMALSVEAGEILEHFQWLTEDESRRPPPETMAEIRDEIGDTLNYLARLSDMLDIDPIAAALEKIKKNAEKYPADKARGKADKYTKLSP